MKRKQLFLTFVAMAALFVAVGLWLARPVSLSDESAAENPTADVVAGVPSDNPNSGQPTNVARQHAPPDQTRKFREFTPEQRVEFARKGHGPGG